MSSFVPPPGDGFSRETAKWTKDFTADPSQPSFVAHTQLDTVKYHRCTLSEAKEYEQDGHKIWDEATRRLWRPFPTAVSAYGSTVDPNAFYGQLEKVRNAEKALDDAGQSADHDESLTGDANEDSDANEEKSEVASSESESMFSDGVFDKPEKSWTLLNKDSPMR